MEAGHGGAGGVGAVGGIGDDDLGALGVAPGRVVGFDQQKAGQLSMGRPPHGLEGHVVHAGDLAQQLLGGAQHFKGALDGGFRLQGWIFWNPSRAAASSLTLGLYFMVQEPRGRTRR